MVLLILFGAFTVAGVLVFALFVGNGSSATISPVTVWGTLDEGAFQDLVRRQAENHGQLASLTYVQKDPETYERALTNALANGEGPDLFILRQDQVIRNAGKTFVIPFDMYPRDQFENTFVEAAKPFYTPLGVVGIPLVADPLVLYWNKDLLAAAGFAQAPKYWDELFNISQKITIKDDSGTIKRSAVAMGEYKNVTNAKDLLATLILQAGGTITARDSAGTLISALGRDEGNASPTVSALRYYSDFADSSKEIYTWNRSLPDAARAFGSGDLALYVGYASEESVIRGSNSNLNYAVAPLPQIRSGAPMTVARVYGVAVSRTGKNVNNAITAAFLLASSDSATTLSSGLGISSARRDLVSISSGGNAELYNKQVIIARSWMDPDPEGTAEVFRGMIENTTSGLLLINEAVKRADQELSQVLSI